MKTYTQLLSTLIILLLVVGCSPKREMVPNLEERVENFFENGNPIMVSGNPFTGILYSEHTNGQISVEIRVKKGIPNGVFEAYYDNGQLEEKGTYKHGKQDSLWEYYYKNGQLSRKGTYKDGKGDGLWEYYYENGQLEMTGNFKDGELDGLWESYYRDGSLINRQSGHYENGKRVKGL